MARAYSDDLRRKVLGARGSGSVTMRSLAERFGVSYGWVRKICAAERRTGSIQQRHGPLSRIDPHGAVAGEKPAGHRAARVAVGAWQVRGAGQHRACGASVETTRLASEKKSIHATERDTEENRRRREAFVEELRTIATEDLIYLDESGISTQMTRTYVRAPRGQRVHAAVPGGCWKMVTILGAMDCNGMLAATTFEAATDREVFLEYLDQVLCPKPRSDHVVVMDNLSAHKVDGARERIEQTGARLLYLPPYSPDLNPIEKLWAKLKQALRAAGVRTADASTKLSLTCCQPSLRKMPLLGLDCHYNRYTNWRDGELI